MKKFNSIRDTIYNKVYRKPKNFIGSYLRSKCDRIPENRRLTVVSVLLSLFVLTTFFVFGNACYRIGRGQAAAEWIEVKHIEGMELPASDENCKSDSLMVEYNAIEDEFSRIENENQ